ncbi:hypothetical protein CMV_021846 [Castanea mollissima]|uniref:Uncharacterized protein n=1 Tax=Castanea mollissima TaxID=60419 RepID=A0A8J4VK83_9ROSI|nr:hypothetical protein CMV_021846 [Castanea mollissima]
MPTLVANYLDQLQQIGGKYSRFRWSETLSFCKLHAQTTKQDPMSTHGMAWQGMLVWLAAWLGLVPGWHCGVKETELLILLFGEGQKAVWEGVYYRKMEEGPNDRKIGKLCEYAAKIRCVIPKLNTHFAYLIRVQAEERGELKHKKRICNEFTPKAPTFCLQPIQPQPNLHKIQQPKLVEVPRERPPP